MKLAEALILRADIQNRILQLGNRLNNNAKVQEGDKPAESPVMLLAQLDDNIELFAQLVTNINITNAVTHDGDVTITELISRRDALTRKVGILRSFLNEASEKVDRYSNKEIKICGTVNVAELQKRVDALSMELRELDMRLQRLNWEFDLLENNH